MSIRIFTPPVQPSTGSRRKPELKILLAEFGDGYSQATRAGMNHRRQVLELKWEALSAADALSIVTFLEEHGGTDAFLYQLPGDLDPLKVTCAEWDETFMAGYRQVTATFRQSFNNG